MKDSNSALGLKADQPEGKCDEGDAGKPHEDGQSPSTKAASHRDRLAELESEGSSSDHQDSLNSVQQSSGVGSSSKCRNIG